MLLVCRNLENSLNDNNNEFLAATALALDTLITMSICFTLAFPERFVSFFLSFLPFFDLFLILFK